MRVVEKMISIYNFIHNIFITKFKTNANMIKYYQ